VFIANTRFTVRNFHYYVVWKIFLYINVNGNNMLM
jgi:hypothetical protein